MRPSSLESKTVRPGLLAYSFYASDRRPVRQPVQRQTRTKAKSPPKLLIIPVLLVVFFGFKMLSQPQPSLQASAAPAALAAAKLNECVGASDDRTIIVSISQRHLWACDGQKGVYDSVVITGMTQHPETLTPPGTYHIYAKVKDTTLTGADVTGNWRDPVSYWMPFLDNQHGTYGLHDATWRNGNEFGNVDPNSDKASHGCVELPLAASKWLYSWAQVGTTVQIGN